MMTVLVTGTAMAMSTMTTMATMMMATPGRRGYYDWSSAAITVSVLRLGGEITIPIRLVTSIVHDGLMSVHG